MTFRFTVENLGIGWTFQFCKSQAKLFELWKAEAGRMMHFFFQMTFSLIQTLLFSLHSLRISRSVHSVLTQCWKIPQKISFLTDLPGAPTSFVHLSKSQKTKNSWKFIYIVPSNWRIFYGKKCQNSEIKDFEIFFKNISIQNLLGHPEDTYSTKYATTTRNSNLSAINFGYWRRYSICWMGNTCLPSASTSQRRRSTLCQNCKDQKAV